MNAPLHLMLLCLGGLMLTTPATMRAQAPFPMDQDYPTEGPMPGADETREPHPPMPPAMAGPAPVGSPPMDEMLPPEQSAPEIDGEPLAVLERLLNASPDKLARLRELIIKIENMSPEDKAQMRERIEQFHELNGTQRRGAMRRMEHIPPQDRRVLMRHWLRLPPEQARAERQRLLQMSPEERRAYRERIVEEADQPE